MFLERKIHYCADGNSSWIILEIHWNLNFFFSQNLYRVKSRSVLERRSKKNEKEKRDGEKGYLPYKKHGDQKLTVL